MDDEHVLCFPTSELERLGRFEGYSRDEKYLELLSSPLLSFQPRSTCETDPNFKQLIPYHVIRRRGEVLSYVRTKQSGEERLRQKRSIGIGGHINPEDFAGNVSLPDNYNPADITHYQIGGMRELDEELMLAYSSLENHIVGFINDEREAVGRVHFGVVHLVTIDRDGGVGPKDPALELNGFMPPHELNLAGPFPLEGWSQLVLDFCPEIDE